MHPEDATVCSEVGGEGGKVIRQPEKKSAIFFQVFFSFYLKSTVVVKEGHQESILAGDPSCVPAQRHRWGGSKISLNCLLFQKSLQFSAKKAGRKDEEWGSVCFQSDFWPATSIVYSVGPPPPRSEL